MRKSWAERMERMRQRREFRRWQGAAAAAEFAAPAQLRRLRQAARQLKPRLDHILRVADARLALPLAEPAARRLPAGADWAWRPDAWSRELDGTGAVSAPTPHRIHDGLVLHHDCPLDAMILRQTRNRGDDDLAPFGLRLEVFEFSGTFLSLALDLPVAAAAGLKKRHLIRLDLSLEAERRLELFARLNIQHGPNVEQQVREMPGVGALMVEFDLAYTKIDERRVERLWLDLILEAPAMNAIALRDLALCRLPRAPL